MRTITPGDVAWCSRSQRSKPAASSNDRISSFGLGFAGVFFGGTTDRIAASSPSASVRLSSARPRAQTRLMRLGILTLSLGLFVAAPLGAQAPQVTMAVRFGGDHDDAVRG